ncbi:MAG: hypothetical protein HOW73_47855 [Polyangiaceae bacterium]|nr:hypothetical protein [Polyangiaceae bacterium]
MFADDRPTWIPSAWPTAEELCPVRDVRYPAPPNTDERPTLIPTCEVSR